jgi:hypothetical protein
MTRLGALALSMLVGGGLGYLAERIPVRPALQSVSGALVGWLAGTAVYAIAWFLRAVSGTGMAAVSVGIVEGFLMALLVPAVAALIHAALAGLGAPPSLLKHLPALLGMLSAVLGALGFTPAMPNAGKT